MKKLLIIICLCLLAYCPVLAAGVQDGQYVLVFKNEILPDNYEQIIHNSGGTVLLSNPDIGTVLVKQQKDEMVGSLKKHPLIEDIGVEGKVKPDMLKKVDVATESLPMTGSLYDLYQWDIKRVGGNPETWALEEGNHSVIIGIIDTGVDKTHPDIKENYIYGKSLLPGWDDAGQDLIGHGTFVAGEIAGNGQIKGVGPCLGIASYRIFGDGLETSMSILAKAIVEAANDGVEIINLSVGGYVDMSDKELKAQYKELQRAVQYAVKKGVLIVASGGNESLNLNSSGNIKYVPGDLKGVITVSATNNCDELAFYSNYGASLIDYCAPGGDFGPNFVPDDMSTIDLSAACFGIVPGGYTYAIGTSMAAPKVAGVLGLIKAHSYEMTSKDIEKVLFRSTEDIGKRNLFGRGLVNALTAVSNE